MACFSSKATRRKFKCARVPATTSHSTKFNPDGSELSTHWAGPAGTTALRDPCYLQKMLSPLPVSKKVFMLESTFGQPLETPFSIFEPAFNLSCVTTRQVISSIASISNVTRDLSARSSGSAQDSTRRLGGLLSSTLPVIQTSFSGLWCSHFEPRFQSDTFVMFPQYRAVNSGLVMAAHASLGDERI